MSPPDDRFRRPTVPPAPAPKTDEGRLIRVEHIVATLDASLGDLKYEVNGLTTVMRDVQNTLLVSNTEKSAADKRRDTFMKWVVGVSVGVSVAALGSLAAWVIHLQTAMSAVGK
jgi:hypothetical protein